GKTYAFVGASGAGKTTTADLLSRFYEVSSGRVTMDGVDIRQIRRDDLRELVGTVSQFPFVWRDTVAANITFGLGKVSREQIEQAAKQAFAHDFIVQLPQGYDTVLGDNGMNLSGGQRQRIVIARAILKNAPILVLDEATSALDAESEIKVQQALEKLMQGRTSVVIAHRISTIRNADCIVVFEDGKIVEQGTHSQLMEKGGGYAKYVNLQTL
ncbi:MAG: ATP-binding cassette domain-containing protein, partial [Bacteroidales bacterium]|nr:ATP-binding cassette domain-containing protein [Bacteroidales bacterium]